MLNHSKIISFSSPKGGVGRTLTLTNCALLYSKGVTWAGISPSSVLLADFDFYAPGIHFYNFAGNDESPAYILHDKSYQYKQVLDALDVQEVGLLFFLSYVIKELDYIKICKKIIQQYRADKQSEDVLKNYQRDTLALLRTEKFNPFHHLIEIPEKSIYILPAASPNHRNFDKMVFDFNWNSFINQSLGLDLLDCIFFLVSEKMQKDAKPVRILLDQQGGSSIASAVNKTLADAHILVSGFNEQNKSGLKSLLDSHYTNFGDVQPWVVLNQYKFRNLLNKAYTAIQENKSPHQLFKEIDRTERLDYIDSLKVNKERIFVTEFVPEAIQSEYFYKPEHYSTDELTRLLTGLEMEFSGTRPPVVKYSALRGKVILFMAEEVVLDTRFAGAFHGLFQSLKLYFPYCRIIGLSASHNDIVQFSYFDACKVDLQGLGEQSLAGYSLRDLPEGIYKVMSSADGPFHFNTGMLDFMGYPYHLQQALNQRQQIDKVKIADFVAGSTNTETLIPVNQEYYAHHILQWNQYSVDDEYISGVPLFLDFQLLVYSKKFFSNKSNLRYLFRKHANRNFEGFKNPQDILDFVKLAANRDNHLKKLLMFNKPEVYELWYEWLTIFSIFFYGANMPEEIAFPDRPNDVSRFREFLISPEAIDAMMQYLILVRWCTNAGAGNGGQKTDWNQVLTNFFDPVDEQSNALILLWPDTIPLQFREDDEYIYQAPPSFKIFEECWLLSMIVSSGDNRLSKGDKLGFMNFYLSRAGQQHYLKEGGLPVHKSVISSLDTWRCYPFIPALCQIYMSGHSGEELVKNWQGIAGVVHKFYDLLNTLRNGRFNKEEVESIILQWD